MLRHAVIQTPFRKARDRLRKFEKTKEPITDAESQQCADLITAMSDELARSGDQQKAWDDNWEAVYQLAEVMMNRVMDEWLTRGGSGSGNGSGSAAAAAGSSVEAITTTTARL
jgi:hypothetical protein